MSENKFNNKGMVSFSHYFGYLIISQTDSEMY